jgi:fatty-acid peroxygenase
MADLALQLKKHGYQALPRLRSAALDPDAFPARLLGRSALVVRGPEGARLFYDDDVVRRRDAVPPPLADLLFGHGAVHGLDGLEHKERKQVFLDVLTRERVRELGETVAGELAAAVEAWPLRPPFSLFDELVRAYGVSVVAWAGVDVPPHEAARLSRELAVVVDGFGFAGRAYARAWMARLHLNRWARRVVEEARSGDRQPAPGTMLHALAHGRGASLPAPVAGVELLNVIRPAVAVAWLGTFAALALTEHARHGPVLADPDQHRARRAFANEVRRVSPFVPALAGRLRHDVQFRSHRMVEGDFLVLDVPGTNHHEDVWDDPAAFRPERFLSGDPGIFDFVPQGGGEVGTGHRCPGEGVAMTLLDHTLLRLSRTAFTVAGSAPDLDRIPTLPGNGLLVVETSLLDQRDLPAAS